jgi:hypothetical protein
MLLFHSRTLADETHDQEEDMQTVDEALEMVFAALRAAAPPLGMERRILERCASWLGSRCRSVDQVRKD